MRGRDWIVGAVLLAAATSAWAEPPFVGFVFESQYAGGPAPITLGIPLTQDEVDPPPEPPAEPSPSDLPPQPRPRAGQRPAAVEQAGAACPAGGACPPDACICSCCCGPTWTASIGPVFLHRSDPDAVPLIRTLTGATRFSAAELDFPYDTGLEFRLGKWLSPCTQCELRFLAVDEWDAQAGAGYLATDTDGTNPGTPFGVAGTALFAYGSELHSTELNLRRSVSPCCAILVGLRWIEVDDTLVQSFTRAAGATTFAVNADNHLYGFQLGAETALLRRGAWQIDGAGKIGLFHNSADQSTVDTQPGIATGRADDTTSLVAELSVSASRPLCDGVSLVVDYRALWIEGVALAADQVPQMNDVAGGHVARQLDMSGVFYHGVFVGVQVER